MAGDPVDFVRTEFYFRHYQGAHLTQFGTIQDILVDGAQEIVGLASGRDVRVLQLPQIRLGEVTEVVDVHRGGEKREYLPAGHFATPGSVASRLT
jgi:hypothetical protein